MMTDFRTRYAGRSSSQRVTPEPGEVAPAERNVEPRLNLRVEDAGPAARLTPRGKTWEELLDRRTHLDDVRSTLGKGDRARRGTHEQTTPDRIATAHYERAHRVLGLSEPKERGADSG